MTRDVLHATGKVLYLFIHFLDLLQILYVALYILRTDL